jgi:hypothetical protein
VANATSVAVMPKRAGIRRVLGAAASRNLMRKRLVSEAVIRLPPGQTTKPRRYSHAIHHAARRRAGHLAARGAGAPTPRTDWEGDGGAKHVVGIIMPLGFDKSFGIATKALRCAVRVAPGEHIRISTRKRHGLEGRKGGSRPNFHDPVCPKRAITYHEQSGTASAIASASRKSFSCPFEYGRTYFAGISRASCPSICSLRRR